MGGAMGSGFVNSFGTQVGQAFYNKALTDLQEKKDLERLVQEQQLESGDYGQTLQGLGSLSKNSNLESLATNLESNPYYADSTLATQADLAKNIYANDAKTESLADLAGTIAKKSQMQNQLNEYKLKSAAGEAEYATNKTELEKLALQGKAGVQQDLNDYRNRALKIQEEKNQILKGKQYSPDKEIASVNNFWAESADKNNFYYVDAKGKEVMKTPDMLSYTELQKAKIDYDKFGVDSEKDDNYKAILEMTQDYEDAKQMIESSQTEGDVNYYGKQIDGWLKKGDINQYQYKDLQVLLEQKKAALRGMKK